MLTRTHQKFFQHSFAHKAQDRISCVSRLSSLSSGVSIPSICPQAAADKLAKSLEGQLSELNDKADSSSRSMNDLNSEKSRLQNANNDLQRQLEEAQDQINQLGKAKSSLSKQLEETTGALDDESRQKSKLQGENRNLQGDLDALRDSLDQEQEAAGDLQRQIKKAQDEAHMWKSRFESGEGGVSSEAMDELKKKFQRQMRALEEQLEGAQSKANSADKDRRRLQAELEDVMVDAEKVLGSTQKPKLKFNSALNSKTASCTSQSHSFRNLQKL